MILIRQALAELRFKDALDNKEIIKAALSYFNRQDDHEQVRTAIKNRYDTHVVSAKNPGDGQGVTETYVRGHLSTQVDNDQIENFSVGFAPKVVGALATLFTEKGQKYTLTHETADSLEAAEKLLYEDNRGASNYDATMADVDKMSVRIGSSGVFPEFARGRMTYKKLSPADVDFYFADYIIEEDKKRVVDRTDPEDATVMVINFGTHDSISWNYLAIFGRSDIYKNGRHVQFQGPAELTQIPELDAEGTIEHKTDHEGKAVYANPLTWWGNQPEQKDKDIPEYPIVIFKGGTTDNNEVMPVYTSLYDAAKGFDIDASHAESTSQKAAAGTRKLTRNSEARSKPIPKTLSGDVALPEGMDVDVVMHDVAASQVALEITEKNMLHCGSGFHVPDFDIVSQDHTIEASSGVALAIKSMPKIKNRDYRIKLNKPQVKRLFEIEKAYIGHHAPSESKVKDADIKLLLECDQTWDPGDLVLPENKKEKTERNIALKGAGGIDEIEFIRRENNFPSDEEAIDFYDKMKERASRYKSLVQEPEPEANKKKPLGLAGRPKAAEL